MADNHAKEINLKHTTVKIPGQRPPKALTSSQPQQTSDSRPTTPVELLTENNNSRMESLAKNATVIQNGLALECSQVDGIDLDASANLSGASNAVSSSSKGEQNPTNAVKKKNKRRKHTKSCEIDYEELEKALASAATTVAAVQPIMRNESHNSSLKKKGHRRAKSGSGKFDTDTGNNIIHSNFFDVSSSSSLQILFSLVPTNSIFFNPENLDFEFTIISLDGKYWNFEAGSQEVFFVIHHSSHFG